MTGKLFNFFFQRHVYMRKLNTQLFGYQSIHDVIIDKFVKKLYEIQIMLFAFNVFFRQSRNIGQKWFSFQDIQAESILAFRWTG